MLAQNVDGLLLRRPRQPGVDVSDRALIERCREKQTTEQVLSRRIEVGIGLGSRIVSVPDV